MADVDHTLESLSALENSPLIINLTVSEIFVAAPKGIGCIALSVIPTAYEPSILLQGEWVRAMGFENGQRIEVVAMSNILVVEHRDDVVTPPDRYDFNMDRLALFNRFKEELDAIKAAYADRKYGERGGRNGETQGSRQGSEKGREGQRMNGSPNGNENGDQNGITRDDKSDVLAEVDNGENRG